MAYKYKELKKLKDRELIEIYDKIAENTSCGLGHIEQELDRRMSNRVNLTITICTIIMTILTAINVYVNFV